VEDLVRYLKEIVTPTVADFEANPTSVRHAFLACVATFHAVDYLAYPRKSPGTRSRFRDQSTDFALVDRIAHAFKHVATGHENARGNPRLTFREVIPRPPAHWGTATWGLSRWGDNVGGVTLDHERNVDLLTVVKEAVEFLRQQTG
jgi:hypothetical protein